MSRSSYRLIRVGKFMTGMLGLDEIFAELYQAGVKPDKSAAAELVRKAREDNYIPPAAEGEFAEALLREYQSYYQAQNAPGGQAIKRRPTWRGTPREQVPWYPSIFEDLCNGCGNCIQFCPAKVFVWTEDRSKVVVAAPFDCQVGCNACERICPCEAITFPPRSILEGLGWRKALRNGRNEKSPDDRSNGRGAARSSAHLAGWRREGSVALLKQHLKQQVRDALEGGWKVMIEVPGGGTQLIKGQIFWQKEP